LRVLEKQAEAARKQADAARAQAEDSLRRAEVELRRAREAEAARHQAEAVAQGVRQKADRAISSNNLKQIALAMHIYLDTNKTLPAGAVYDKNGRPLLSWRVLLLPYLEENELFKKFKMDEPWDGPNNKKLLEKIPSVYAAVGVKPKEKHSTFYRVFTGPGTVFEGTKGIRLTDITDGTANTILVVEAAEPVIWTKPDDLPYDPKKPLPKLGVYPDGAHVLAGDGDVWRLSPQTTEKAVRGAIERGDGAGISDPQSHRIPSRGPAPDLELERRAAAPAAPRPVLLKSFDPAKDKPVPPARAGAEKAVTVENGVWRIENSTNTGNFNVLFGTVLDGIPDN